MDPSHQSSIPQPASSQTVAREEALKRARKGSAIPRPLTQGSVRYKSVAPFSDNGGGNARSRFGFARHRPAIATSSASQETQQIDNITALQTTPTEAEHQFLPLEVTDENAFKNGSSYDIISQGTPALRKKPPRPSLSERTIETLSRIPPSPSFSRQRSNTGASNSSVGSQPFLSPGPKTTRPDQFPGGRGPSPRRSIANLSTRPAPVTNTISSIPARPQLTARSTPHKVSLAAEGSKIAGYAQRAQQSPIVTMNDSRLSDRPQQQQAPHGHKVRSMYDLRTAAAISSRSKPAVASNSRDIPRTSTRNGVAKPLRLRERVEEDRTVPDSPLTAKVLRPPRRDLPTAKVSTAPKIADSHTISTPTPKFSQTLRETIVKVKAAKKQGIQVSQDVTASDPSQTAPYEISNNIGEPLSGLSLKKRIQSALITGVLNIAASGLSQIPEEVLHMYDFDENSKIPWSEAVDMNKLIASDNEIETLSDNVFPDWSVQDAADDEEKTNVFVCLETLDLRNNRLTILPIGLRRLEQLQVLNLNSNKLTNEALDAICQLRQLKELHVANNRFSGSLSESIMCLRQLRILDIGNNKISELPDSISGLHGLQRLDVSKNMLTKLPSGIASLHLMNLNLSQNNLRRTLFEANVPSSLVHMDVSSNKLEHICTAENDEVALQTLTADNNNLLDLPDLSRFSALTTLTVAQNKLKEIPRGFTALRTVRNVNLSCNDIKQLDPEISNMGSLAALNLAGNPLRERRFLGMNLEDLKMDLAARLETSDVEEGSVGGSSFHDASSTIQPSPMLYTPQNGVLDLSSQGLSSVSLDVIDLDRPIHTIKLSHNDLTFFPISLLSHPEVVNSLKHLDLSHNASFHPSSYLASTLELPSLNSMDLSSTNMTLLNSLMANLSAPNLHTFNVSNNRLSGLLPRLRISFPTLTTLITSNNHFTNIDVEAVRGLEVLDIRDNELEAIPPKIGELGYHPDKAVEKGRLRSLECSGNRFRVPRPTVLEKGTEAVLRDLRRMVPVEEVDDEWRDSS